jgi:hypothetical protein
LLLNSLGAADRRELLRTELALLEQKRQKNEPVNFVWLPNGGLRAERPGTPAPPPSANSSTAPALPPEPVRQAPSPSASAPKPASAMQTSADERPVLSAASTLPPEPVRLAPSGKESLRSPHALGPVEGSGQNFPRSRSGQGHHPEGAFGDEGAVGVPATRSVRCGAGASAASTGEHPHRCSLWDYPCGTPRDRDPYPPRAERMERMIREMSPSRYRRWRTQQLF